MDFWFMPPGAKVGIPVRWKQWMVTWSAIYPLGLMVPLMVRPALAQFSLDANRPVTTLVVSGIVVFLMVYVVMPRYTRLLRRWLFARNSTSTSSG